MDIIMSLLTLPFAPVRGLVAVVNVIAQEAQAKRYNPANVGRELEELDSAVQAGDMSPEEREEAQKQLLEPLTTVTPNRAGQRRGS